MKIRIKAVKGNSVYKTLYQVWYGPHFIDSCTSRKEAQIIADKVVKEETRKEQAYGKL